MKKLPHFSLTFASGALIVGCLFDNGAETRTQAMARFDIQAVSSINALAKHSGGDTPALTMKDSSGLTFQVTEARVFIDKIKLKPVDDDSCENGLAFPEERGDSGHADDEDSGDTQEEACDDSRTLKGPFVVDLMTGSTTPFLAGLPVPAGVYKKVKIHLDHANESDAIVNPGDPLLNHTLYVKGAFALPGQPEQAFTLKLKFDEDVEIESREGMQLDAAALSTVFISLKLDTWLSELSIGACLAMPKVLASQAGEVELSEKSELGKCLDIEKTVKENIRNSFEVEDDRDRDGKRRSGRSGHDSGKDSI